MRGSTDYPAVMSSIWIRQGFLLGTLVLTFTLNVEAAISDEQRLMNHLFSDQQQYEKTVRPARNASETVRVSFGLSLLGINNVDLHNSALDATFLMRHVWQDYRLMWDPAEFGGVEKIPVLNSRLWKPDLVLYNSVGTFEHYQTDALAVVQSDGTVSLEIPSTLHSKCSYDLMHYPFDIQTCKLKFRSRIYDGFQVEFHLWNGDDHIDLTDYVVSKEWKVIDSYASRSVWRHPAGDDMPYVDLWFSVTMKRQASVSSNLFIVPAYMTTLVTPSLFLLPLNKPHRFVFGSGLVVTSAVMTTAYNFVIPGSGTFYSLLGFWLVSILVINLVVLVISAVVSYIADKDGQPMHPLLKKILVRPLARCCCLVQKESHKNSHIAMSENEAGDKNSQLPRSENEDGVNKGDWLQLALIINRLFFILCSITVLFYVTLCTPKQGSS